MEAGRGAEAVTATGAHTGGGALPHAPTEAVGEMLLCQ